MVLATDPSVIYAALLNNRYNGVIHQSDLHFESPYNTYLHTGLPPGPVMMPSVNALNSVLDYKKTDYLYMCAKADFSGYHAFATNVADHLVNARAFQKALSERHIMK